MSSLYNLKNCLKSLFHTFNGADEESRRKPVCALSFKVCTGSKPYKLLKFFTSFVTTVKSRHAPTIWKELSWKSLCLPILKSITEIMKNFKTLYGFGGRCFKIREVLWILSHISRAITWSLFTLKASYLFKWSISTWSFMWCCQFIDWLKFETRPSSLLNFGTAYL